MEYLPINAKNLSVKIICLTSCNYTWRHKLIFKNISLNTDAPWYRLFLAFSPTIIVMNDVVQYLWKLILQALWAQTVSSALGSVPNGTSLPATLDAVYVRWMMPMDRIQQFSVL